jgi:hypothetical protein
MDSPATCTGLLRSHMTSTTTLNGNHTHDFVQNDLCHDRYETLPLNARIPGYAGFVPGGGTGAYA